MDEIRGYVWYGTKKEQVEGPRLVWICSVRVSISRFALSRQSYLDQFFAFRRVKTMDTIGNRIVVTSVSRCSTISLCRITVAAVKEVLRLLPS